ncbi:hypothetical protein F8388_001077 [Cannabis sativa]|uniref:DUF4283 domain-containing protein n=1 Tax=Cannabis sativa TaxID=3483 RepID=A0A7J6DYL0_CANSA|nr:hypothetical protein F8388_001077 [Cannabis sativa]KAF4377458.1 hypothetical protein G4B88_020972 [Cannabis sativa]
MTMEEVVGSASSKQGRCLSLNEVSISLAPSVVEQTCSHLRKSRVKVQPTDGAHSGSNTFRFSFDNGSASKWVLEQGPWCVKGDMLVLLPWSSGF